MSATSSRPIEVRVPASTANLGAGFDCLGLALQLYLTVRATIQRGAKTSSIAHSRGVAGSSKLPTGPGENLILRAMRHAAEREGLVLPDVHLAVQNEIPIAGGLGSSSAAILAGIALAFAVCGKRMPKSEALRYAAELERHTDNAGAALLGGLVVSFDRADGSVVAVRRNWPQGLHVIAVTPELSLETKASRATLPKSVEHSAAVHNTQRAALFVAALDAGRYDLLWDAMQDRLHQSYRAALIPGLESVLRIPAAPGLMGIALSGAGPTVIALSTKRGDTIGKTIAAHFKQNGLRATIRRLAVDQQGLRLKPAIQFRRQP